jgi:uncharacterized protein
MKEASMSNDRKPTLDERREMWATEDSGVQWEPAKGSDRFATCPDRRTFLKGGALLFGGLALSWPLQQFMARKAYAASTPIASPYGAPVPTADNATGLNLIKLPPGFEYWSFGWTGDPLGDGYVTPRMHDGMAVVKTMGNSGKMILCRNHEVDQNSPPFAGGPIQYGNGGGGNVNVVWNGKKQIVEDSWASLSGTVRNCAGGVTPWSSWISCEETNAFTNVQHGYCFDVHANGKGAANSRALLEMGRFSHEALAVDPATGIVYETEDGPSFAGDVGSGFYRFLPNKNGQLHRGGTLQMLAISGQPQKDLLLAVCGDQWDVEWVTIPNPDPAIESGETSVFQQGFIDGEGSAKGASFRRLEGCWYGEGKIYFLSTDGGPNREGQVFEYDPGAETLKVIFHSTDFNACDNPDNIVVTPRGGLIMCEDNAGGQGSFFDGERLLGLTLNGEVFTFAVNNLDFTPAGLGPYTRPNNAFGTFNVNGKQNEWAGACYSADGQWLFANCQGSPTAAAPGLTYAIRPIGGNWGAGPL